MVAVLASDGPQQLTVPQSLAIRPRPDAKFYPGPHQPDQGTAQLHQANQQLVITIQTAGHEEGSWCASNL